MTYEDAMRCPHCGSTEIIQVHNHFRRRSCYYRCLGCLSDSLGHIGPHAEVAP